MLTNVQPQAQHAEWINTVSLAATLHRVRTCSYVSPQAQFGERPLKLHCATDGHGC